MLRWMTAGESHGEALTAVLEGVPAGVRITSEDIRAALARRRLGHGRGARQAFERDELRVLGGIRHGSTIGSPIALQIGNSEWPKWSTVMSADPVDPNDLLIDAGTGDEREIARNRPLTRPRPGHADLPGMLKYDLPEARPVLERASARETAARVALGAVAEAILEQVAGVRLVSHVMRIGSVALPDDVPPPRAEDTERLDADPVRCTDPATSAAMVAEIDATRKDGDTLGGVVEVIATGVPVGLGTHVSADRRLDARLPLSWGFRPSKAWRSVTASPRLPGGAQRLTTRSSQWTAERSPGPPTAPAASRAVSPTAPTCGYGSPSSRSPRCPGPCAPSTWPRASPPPGSTSAQTCAPSSPERSLHRP